MGKKKLGILKGILVLCTIFSSVAHARDKVVYGDDNRVDVENSSQPVFQEWARSVAAMIPVEKMKMLENGLLMEIKAEKNPMNMCADEPFSDQVMVANCTGFLVAPDLLVTAGHCVRSNSSCTDFRWVFDFQSDKIGRTGLPVIPAGNVYSCKEIVAQSLDMETKMDYGLVRLDRKVTDRFSLPFRKTGQVEVKSEMVIIGHPSGLPLKIADHAVVRSNENASFFVINSDTFGGNSGSPVIDAQTGLVEGILVRGDRDYNYNIEKNCYSVQHWEDNAGRGEDATKINKIPYLVNGN